MRLLPFLLLLLAACRRESSLTHPDPDLLAGSYRKVYERAGGQNLWCTYYHDTCALDNRYRFEPDGRYVVDDAGIPCTLAEEPGGHWQLEGESLRINGSPYRVRACNGRSLLLDGLRIGNGFEVRVEVRYERE